MSGSRDDRRARQDSRARRDEEIIRHALRDTTGVGGIIEIDGCHRLGWWLNYVPAGDDYHQQSGLLPTLALARRAAMVLAARVGAAIAERAS